MDLAGRIVRVRGQEIRLTPTEFKLLAVLVRHAGKVVTHRQLLTEIWGPAAASNAHYVRVQNEGLGGNVPSAPPPDVSPRPAGRIP